jgi:hypothetical protein
LAWAFRTALCYVAGYGIGLYTFRVVWWVLVFSLVFGILLWRVSPEARIRFRGREAERASKKTHEWGTRLFYAALCGVAGYGISLWLYSFRAGWWVLVFSLVFAALLWWLSPAARCEPRGAVWCFGASLSRLLPVIDINKEFADFFNDPNRDRLKFWPSMLFNALGVFGWLLAAVLIVAVSGSRKIPDRAQNVCNPPVCRFSHDRGRVRKPAP